MSALDDTKAAIGALGSKVSKLSTDVEAFIAANSGGASDADLQALTAGITAIGAQVDAVDQIVNPPAPPAPPTGN